MFHAAFRPPYTAWIRQKSTTPVMESTLSNESGLLPQEIIDNIIDYCSVSRDLKILKNCALVSRAFLPRSQWHIFASIRILCAIYRGEIRTGGRRLNDLYGILQHSPHIAGYVRELRLAVTENDSWDASNPKFKWIMDHISRNAVFHRFHFDGRLSNDNLMIAPSHLRLFEKSFSQRYIVPSITSLRLYRAKNVPISLLVSPPRLRKLILIRATLEDINLRNLRLSVTTLPKLQELYFYRCSETVNSLLGDPKNGSPPLLDLSHLHTLSINHDSMEDIQCAMRIIEMTSQSLKQINFIHRNSNLYIPLTGLLNLGNIPNLRSLLLDTVCGDEQALSDLDGVLRTVRPTHKITKVKITVHMNDHTRLSPGDTLSAGCTILDASITKLHHGTTPTTFHLHFFFPRRPPSKILRFSKQGRALKEMAKMGEVEFARMMLTKFPLATALPGVSVVVTRQKEHTPKGTFRRLKGFFRKISKLVK